MSRVVTAEAQHTGNDWELRSHVESSTERRHASNPADEGRGENRLRSIHCKLIACAYSFFISGVNDGLLGPLVPYVLRSFGLSTGELAYLYLCTFLGWVTAMPLNPLLPKYLSLGSILSIGAVLQLAAQFMRPWTSLPVFAISFYTVALGMAIQDSHANTFVSSVKLAHRWLGVIHGSYAAGLIAAPLIATSLASRVDSILPTLENWRVPYLILIGLDALNVLAVAVTFKPFPRWVNETPTDSSESSVVQDLKSAATAKPIVFMAASFFLQLGAVMTAGGWVVEYLTTVRGGDLKAMGYVPTGFNAGTLLGRLLLAEPIHRLGERRAILSSFGIIIVLQVLFWLLPNIIASATALSLLGFFAGPFIPVGINVAGRLVPRKIRSAALGFIFVLAQAGGAFFPSLTGLIAQKSNVGVLQPIVLALILCAMIFWYLVPRAPTDEELDRGTQ
ncbi:Bypass of stop codon-like protein 4 [Elsinoe fawcettii]|nr:Bypass of stop codon-like protein 4 [Elsinoe fawcettii]